MLKNVANLPQDDYKALCEYQDEDGGFKIVTDRSLHGEEALDLYFKSSYYATLILINVRILDIYPVDINKIAKALDYNYRLAQRGIEWKDGSNLDDYYDVLDITHTGVMGYLKINKINVTCPIYHTVDENVLQTGIGHLENTSLPVGAKTYDSSSGIVTDSNDGSHCALSGHRGLPSARLLSDLDKLVEGDMFSLNVLGETYYYQVDQIRVVLPSDVQELNIVPGEDYCTLITCTPYGINTHRLLVRGKRINKPQGDVSIIEDASVISIEYVAPFIAAPILLIIVLIVVFSKPKKKGEKE